jgi:hypothetical protein
LAVDGISIAWRTEAPFALDVADFERLLAEAEAMKGAGKTAETIAALEQALNLYRGPLLNGLTSSMSQRWSNWWC